MTGMIHARHFFTKAADVARNDWHYGAGSGALRHVIAALVGQRIVLEADKRTGHAVEVEVLGKTRTGGPYATPAILVRHHHADGSHHDTAYSTLNIGAIVQLEGGAYEGARWVAARSLHAERAAALDIAKAAHPECSYGLWELTPTFDDGRVMASFTPQRADGGPRWSGMIDTRVAATV